MEHKTFKMDMDFIIGNFALSRNFDCPILAEWTAKSKEVVAEDPHFWVFLERQRQRLIRQGDGWNEEELKMRFLAFLFEYIDFDIEGVSRVFFERTISALVQGYKIVVKCDCLFAKPFGINAPQNPYFFLQEFKKQKNAGDAEAQMLASMLVAQVLNEQEVPLYGAFLQGKNWTFATLQDKNYCVTKQYDATQSIDFQQIILILRNLKQIISQHK